MATTDLLSKSEAIAFLGLKAAKSIERYVKTGKLSVAEWVRPSSGGRPTPLFSKPELARFKATLTPGTDATEATEATEKTTEQTAVLVRDKATGATGEATGVHVFLEALAEWDRVRVATIPIGDKLALSIEEASALSGLSRGHLEEAARDGRLRAGKVGPRGSWLIRREHLDRYLVQLLGK